MPNANIEFALPRRSLSRYIKATPLHALLKFAPWLVDKAYLYQPTERLLEYPFVHENIPFNGRGKILDVGSGSSTLPLELASKGYDVWSIDLVREYHRSIRQDNFTFVKGDIRKTNFPDAFFDIVTAVSTIEHTGFDNNETDSGGDKDAIREIKRILNPGGKLLLTVPFGREGIYFVKGRAQWRVYSLLSLKKLLEGFEITKMEFALLEGGSWRPANLEEAENIDSLSQPRWYSSKALVMVVAES